MAKMKKPFWLKLIIWLVSIFLVLVAIMGAVCAFVYFKYQINVFEVVSQVRILNEEVDLGKITPNTFTIEDMEGAKVITDVNLNGLITYTAQDGYSITPEDVSTNMIGNLKFSDRQIGAIIDNLLENQGSIELQIGDKDVNLNDYGFDIVQVEFSNITEKTTDFNVVAKIDLVKIKEENMTAFPLNFVRNFLPDSLYISATTTIIKGDSPFEYTTEGKSLAINNLNTEDTASVLKAINNFVKIGGDKAFAKIMGDTFIDSLIGNESSKGLAYLLKDAGATDFMFDVEGNSNYFVITM